MIPELTLLLYTSTVCLSLVTIADYFEIKHSEQTCYVQHAPNT